MINQPDELEASQILVPDTGGEYEVYSLLSLTQSMLLATSGTGMAPHHFITQRGPLQDGSSPLDMRWDDGTLQLLIADSQLNRTDYFDARGALVRLLRPNRSFGWPDGVVRPLIFRKWLPYGKQEFGTDLALTAGSNIVRSQTGRFVERGLDPGCTLTISSTVADDGEYVIDDVRNDYTLQLASAMVNAETGAHWNYMRRWGKRDLYCLLEEGPRFDEGPGPNPLTPQGFREALRFVSNDPLWYGQEQSEIWATDLLGALIFDTDRTSSVRAWFGKTRGQGYWFFGVDAAVSESIEVVYWGTVGAKPVVTITGPATNPIIANNTTGARIEMDYSAAAGETITIDTLAQTVTNNFSENLQPFTTGDLATFEIVPHPQAPDGANVMHVSFTEGAVASAVTMAWRARYESLH